MARSKAMFNPAFITHHLGHRHVVPKYEVTIRAVRHASKIQAIARLADYTHMALAQARWFVAQLPQPFAVPEAESFHTQVMTAEEAQRVDDALAPFFELEWREAGRDVLEFGMTAVAPWDLREGATGTPIAEG